MNRLALAALCAVNCGVAAAQQPISLKVATYDPPNTIFVNMFKDWADAVMRDSKGTLKVDIFAGGSLGPNPQQQIKLMMDGVADIVWAVPSFTPGRFVDVEVVEMPLVASDARDSSLALWRTYSRGLVGGLEEIKPLMLGTTNQIGLHAAFPMKSLEDLKGKKFRATGVNLAQIMDVLGATAVQIAPTKTAESVAKGVVDGIAGEWNFVGVFKLDNVTTHHVDVSLGAVAQMIAMTKKRFDSLPEPARAAIDRHSGEAFVRVYGKASSGGAQAARAAVVAKNPPSVTTLTSAQLERFRIAVQPVVDKWLAVRPQNRKLYETYVEEARRAQAELR